MPDIANLEDTLSEVEKGRSARLRLIETLSKQLTQVEKDRDARLASIKNLEQQLAESEKDRTERLTQLEKTTGQLAELEKDRNENGRAIGRHKEQLLEAAHVNEDAAQTVELDQTRQGRLSRMDALQGQAMSIAAKERRKLEMRKIENALARIDSGDYGYCQMCGEEIALKRLEFDLTAEHCISCAEQLET